MLFITVTLCNSMLVGSHTIAQEAPQDAGLVDVKLLAGCGVIN